MYLMQRSRGFNYTYPNQIRIPYFIQVGGYFSPVGLSNIFFAIGDILTSRGPLVIWFNQLTTPRIEWGPNRRYC